jgi:TolA-binding protein
VAEKTLIEKLADRGEEALTKLAENPVAQRALETVNNLRERVDDITKRLSGLEKMEQRLETLEKRVAKLEGAGKTPARKPATPRAKKPAATSPEAPTT